MAEYFSPEELITLKKSEGKTLSAVHYHFWQNKTKPGDIFEFLDKLELIFSDRTRLVFSGTQDDDPGIFLLEDFDAEKTKFLLLKDYGGQIDQRSEDFSPDELWKPAIGKKLVKIELVDDGENMYRNDAVLLNFSTGKIELSPAMEGLIVEPFEEV
ncbi:MAG: hypothetical protein HY064_09200 [Bacteroidetes bacterium]|nr:hypothetical protein [Bacteroidota bacterium]